MKTNQIDTSGPKLQPPGAGLPFSQQLVLRYLVGPFISKSVPLSKCRESYEAITKKLIALVKEVPESQRSTRVLVQPLPGLEDSSRYWSLNGVLEHLLIVSRAVEKGILKLSAGEIPNEKADIAAVKPKSEDQDHSWLKQFEEYASNLLARIDEQLNQPGRNIHSPLKFNHPWFGPFTARQWYWLLPTHQRIHYRQAKHIVMGLNTKS